jgi:uncharacterized protein YndB with AHSA1/START domain
MTDLDFIIKINAPANKIWQVLWYDTTYRKWTSAFHEGSYAVSDWKEGSKVHFLSPGGKGMFSIITECRENELMAFKHLGVIKNFEEQPANEETKAWSEAMEIYSLKENNGYTELNVSMNTIEGFEDYLKKTFPVALNLVKELAENPIEIIVETTVNASIEKAWKYWTTPEHIMQWNNASDNWHTPSAAIDLRTGGSFIYTMAAKDGSFSFDFGGVYDEVKANEIIAYTMGDGRKAKIIFSKAGNQTKIVESFDAEEMNSLELQQGGWQAILNNFKKYTEGN